MSVLECNNVSFLYKNTDKGIREVSFGVNGGDFVAIIGRNGAGKSTLINLLAGILLPEKGEICCDKEYDYHDVGISTQKQSIDWYLNVYDNVALGAALAGKSRKEIKRATTEILDVLELKDFCKNSPDSLSGGQQQRAQVARALVHKPRIMILDEPTTGLDYKYSKDLFEYLQRRCNEEKCLALVSSHDLTLLEKYCNKVLFIENGKQIFWGDMKDFLKAYQINKEIEISFSGDLDKIIKDDIEKSGGGVDEGTIRLPEDKLKTFIYKIIENVSILGIESKRIGLQDIMEIKEGKRL